MKSILKPDKLKYLLTAAGILAAVLQMLLRITGTDEKGLLIRGHWAGVLLCLLTAAAAVLLIAGCRKIRGPKSYCRCYPASRSAGLGCFSGAAGFLLIGLTSRPLAPLDYAAAVSCMLAAAALVWVGICRIRGAKPFFLCHTVVCVSIAMRTVGQYRTFSSHPQILEYGFSMSAMILLMLACYQLAAFDADMGDHRKLWGTMLGAGYLCLAGAYGSEAPLFLILCSVWMLTTLTSPKRRHPVQPPCEEAAP